ncbi:MAG TPA: 2-dehydro-3-deoxygalactonokinase [Beijerinckiaceae bacterium]|nr:2-dehydro-3-deoxygalactonokinase [Beijerinckiaceae bacterium]
MKRIVVDWGSSNFRAYRFGVEGALIERHQAEAGILTVRDGAFEDALEREIGHWLDPETEILLSGMITSRNGWVETPYLEPPASLSGLATRAVARPARTGARLLFLPGVCNRAPQPDVMRGEEIQVFGAVSPTEDALVVLPGTHSKWVSVRAGAIAGFSTFLTGEMFALLCQHSIIGRLIPPGAAGASNGAFLEGVKLGFSGNPRGLLNDVFTARAGALLGDFMPTEIAERLSGILIGHEIRAGFESAIMPGLTPLLVGEAALIARYAVAFSALGLASAKGPDHAAVEGFRKLGALGASHA